MTNAFRRAVCVERDPNLNFLTFPFLLRPRFREQRTTDDEFRFLGPGRWSQEPPHFLLRHFQSHSLECVKGSTGRDIVMPALGPVSENGRQSEKKNAPPPAALALGQWLGLGIWSRAHLGDPWLTQDSRRTRF